MERENKFMVESRRSRSHWFIKTPDSGLNKFLPLLHHIYVCLTFLQTASVKGRMLLQEVSKTHSFPFISFHDLFNGLADATSAPANRLCKLAALIMFVL